LFLCLYWYLNTSSGYEAVCVWQHCYQSQQKSCQRWFQSIIFGSIDGTCYNAKTLWTTCACPIKFKDVFVINSPRQKISSVRTEHNRLFNNDCRKLALEWVLAARTQLLKGCRNVWFWVSLYKHHNRYMFLCICDTEQEWDFFGQINCSVALPTKGNVGSWYSWIFLVEKDRCLPFI
jgi:hypothetical protein